MSDQGSGIAPRAVLWDLDGTLVDSRDHHWQAWRDTLRGEGVALTYEQFLASFGQKNDRILAGWLGAETPAERVQRIGDAKEALYRAHARRDGVVLLPGAIDWVRGLRADGWRQAIASSAPRANVEVVLEVAGLADLIDAVVSAEDVTAGKPDPQVFLVAAARLSIPPARCIVVEDAAAGVEAGRRAGMKTIGVHQNTILNADAPVRSLADLPSDAFGRLLDG
jgi:beta-phosphoglucomutase